LLLGLLAFALLTWRVVRDGEAQMRESDRAFDAGDLRAATLHARRAAVLYAPGAPHVGEAYQRLVAIAVGSEAVGHPEMAVLAWGAVRGAALETRHVFVPHQAELERANQSLARLEALAPSPLTPRASPERIRERALRELERDDAPRAPWVIALVAGFALAFLGLGVTALYGVGKDGTLAVSQAKLGLVLTLLGAACWTIAAWKA
jgi:hypothetical protein